MNFNINEIILNNFLLFKHQRIPLYDQGLVLLKGENKEQPWKGSNACGKSLIGDAIAWLLSGSTSRDIRANSIIGKFGKSCSVEGKIQAGKATFDLARYRKDPIHLNSLQINETTNVSHRRVKDTQNRLDNVIGCSWKLLRMSCFQYGNKIEYFSRLKPTDRAQILDEIVGADEADIPGRYTIVNRLLREIKDEYEKLLLSNVRLRNDDDQILKFVNENKKTILFAETTMKQHEESMRNSIVSFSQDIIDNAMEENKELEAYLAKTGERVLIKNKIKAEIDRAKEIEFNIVSRIAKLSALMSYCSETMNLKIDAGVKCDKCGNLVTQKSLDDMVEEAKKKHDELNVELNSCKEQKKKAKIKLNELEERLEKLNIEINSDSIRLRIEKNKSLIKMEFEKMESQKQIEKDISSMKMQHVKNINELKDNNVQYLLQVKNSSELIKKNIMEKYRIDKKVDTLELLQQFYSPNGFRPMVMEYYAPILSDCANYFFEDFTNGQGKIMIDTKTIQSSGKVVDKVDIQVYENGKRRQFPGEWSEGEGGYIDLSLNLGIMRLASMKAAKEFNFLFLDEILSNLSQKWIGILISFLKNKLLKEGMTILMTSHMPLNENLFDQVWTVRRESGESIIDFGK